MITEENIIYTTTLIKAYNYEKNICNTGTGFFCKDEENYYLISNKHIVDGCTEFEFKVPMYGDDKIVTTKIKIDPSSHSLYDIGVIGINAVMSSNYKYNIKFIEISDFYNDQPFKCSNIENIIMLGYPQGMKGDPLGCPIIKSGITATPISKKYNDQEIFLTDILSFPGSSGSPIFIKYNDSYILVGIHYASATTIDDGSHIGLGFCIKDSILYNWIKGI